MYTQVSGSARLPNRDDDIVWSVRKRTAVEESMVNLYYTVSPSTNGIYVGITKNPIHKRFQGHCYNARKGNNNHLYQAMRKYQDFCIVLVDEFETKDECCDAEVEHIAFLLSKGCNVYNHTSGGEKGFEKSRCLNVEEWKRKLRAARKGKKPALGMRHTEKNKELFSKFGIQRWDKYGRYPNDITNYPFSFANKIYGISKTHYYRLLRAGRNETS